MAAYDVLLNLCAGVALLLWATRMVRTGLLRAFTRQLRRMLARATSAVLAGTLQSSSATALLLVSFCERGMIGLSAALALMLGADLGSTLVVQALSFNLHGLVPMLLLTGVAVFMASATETPRQVGRILIGLALLLSALAMIITAGKSLQQSEVLLMVLQRVAGDPILATLIGCVLAWLMHSSVAMVLLVMALTDAGAIPLQVGLMLVIGANAGSGLIPLSLTAGARPAARRALWGNLAFRALAVVACATLLSLLPQLVTYVGSSPARQLANVHTLFNLALVVLFLPLTATAAQLLLRFMPGESAGVPSPVAHLDNMLLDKPALALGCATRETLRLADMVETMLRTSILAFKDAGAEHRSAVRRLEEPVDRTYEAIKLYLTRLTRRALSNDESRRAFDLTLFTTNLEHIGDIIAHGLLRLAAKKQKQGLQFSAEGWAEIEALHGRVVAQMQLALTLLVRPDTEIARALVAEKDRIRAIERAATEAHLARLRQGLPASLETTALHLDVLRDLKRINAHVVSAAYPILEASGEIRDSRLKQPTHANQQQADTQLRAGFASPG
jgi:phosphate:Na+ symporter